MDDDVQDLIEQRLEDGYRPVPADGDPEDFDPADYAWGMVPCPHCGKGFLLGLYDPEYEYEESDAIFAVLAPGSDDEEE